MDEKSVERSVFSEIKYLLSPAKSKDIEKFQRQSCKGKIQNLNTQIYK